MHGVDRGVTDDELPKALRRMSQSDKEEIAQMVFDQLFVWAGRSIAKKLWLFLVALLFALVGWFAKDHIR